MGKYVFIFLMVVMAVVRVDQLERENKRLREDNVKMEEELNKAWIMYYEGPCYKCLREGK